MITFARLKRLSLTHSAIYTGLLVAWIAPGLSGPTLVLGWAHGVLWIAMSFLCLTAVRRRIIPLRIGVAVAVIGGVGPFVGSYEFIREQRRRDGALRAAPAP